MTLSIFVKQSNFARQYGVSFRATPETVFPASLTVFLRSAQDLNPARLPMAKNQKNGGLQTICW